MIGGKASLYAGLGVALLAAAASPAAAKPHKRPLPDLVVAKVSKPPATAAAGAKLSLSVDVRNKGAAAAGKSRLAVYLAKGKKHKPKDRRLALVKVKALGPGKRAKAKVRAALPGNTVAGSYRLLVCADGSRRVRESKEGNNCTASRPLRVSSSQTKSGPPAPAFSMSDGIEWGFVEDVSGSRPDDRNPVTVTLRAANGLPGQSGYVRSSVAPQPLAGGATTSLGGSLSNGDDGSTSVSLPFAFPFGGVDERSISVGSNGWVGFDGPASNFWGSDKIDYRGANAVLGDFERAIMPYWGDLDLKDTQGAGAGTIKEVVAADGGSVAFQWDIGQFLVGVPRRVVQLVLFRDGRFRFDYPGENTEGGQAAFIGYSLGTGPAGLDTVASDVEAVPSSSLLFTPKPFAAAGPGAPGQASLTLPADSILLTADAGCGVTTAPTPSTEGLVSCPIPSLAAGEQATRTVVFGMPHDAPGQPRPADFHFGAGYTSGGLTLTDADEINSLSDSSLRDTIIGITPEYTSPATPQVGTPALYTVKFKALAGLAEPNATFTLPANTSLDSIQSNGQAIECGAPTGGQVSCRLPNGLHTADVVVTVTPTAAAANAPLTLGVSARAANTPAATGSVNSPVVTP